MNGPGSDIRAMRQWLYSLWNLAPDAAVLDAGCGDGHDLVQIGANVGARARLVGVNLTPAAIEKARSETKSDSRFEFSVADLAQSWPFEDSVFDLVYSNNVLECLSDKQAFLRETYRALKPGGRVVCAHWDHDTHTIDGVDKALVRKIIAAFSDWKQAWMPDADGWMGRRLWRTFQQSNLFRGEIKTYGLTNTQFAPTYFGYEHITASLPALVRRGFIAQSEYDQFLEEVTALAARNEYFYSVTLYVYIGEKISI